MHKRVLVNDLHQVPQLLKMSPGFYLPLAKLLFFWSNTIIITPDYRGCTFDAALVGGYKLKVRK